MRNKSKEIKIIFGLLLASLLFTFGGCARVGRDFDVQKVHNIKIGETTQNEIRAMFGSPWRKGIDNGTIMWTYGRYTYRLIGETDTTDLIVKFSDDGKVSSYIFNTTMEQR